MGWKQAMEAERAGMMRLAALLCALADLADRAATRRAPVRHFVLWLLRHAEAVARDWVTGAPTPAPPTVDPASGSPSDAIRLAISLRALACAVSEQARLVFAACRRGGDDTHPLLVGRIPAVAGVFHALASNPAFAACSAHLAIAPDTS